MNNNNGDGNGTALLEEPVKAIRVLPNSLQGSVLFKIRKPRKGIELSTSDLQMLSAIEVWGVIGVGEILALRLPKNAPAQEKTRLFFNLLKRSEYGAWGYTRAAQLRRSGYVRAVRYPTCKLVFLLTRKGLEALENKKLRRLEKIRWSISGSRLEHEVTVGSVGLFLKEVLHLGVRIDSAPYGKKLTETGVSASPAVPDLWVATKGGDRAVEIERSQKSWRCLSQKWPAFHLLYPHTPLLYLTTHSCGKDFILASSRRLHADYVYACELNMFRDSLGTTAFHNYEGKTLKLQEALS